MSAFIVLLSERVKVKSVLQVYPVFQQRLPQVSAGKVPGPEVPGGAECGGSPGPLALSHRGHGISSGHVSVVVGGDHHAGQNDGYRNSRDLSPFSIENVTVDSGDVGHACHLFAVAKIRPPHQDILTGS